MKLENREKVIDLLNLQKRLALELNNIQKLQECSIVEIEDTRGYISVRADVVNTGLYFALDHMAREIREKLEHIDAQLEEL